MATKTVSKIRKSETKQDEVKVQRTNRGRKPEALKPYMDDAPVKRYRTRKDYEGSGWTKTLAKATPRSVTSIEPTETVNAVRKRATAPKPTPAPMRPQEVKTRVVRRKSVTAVENNQPMAAEFAYNLMELCSKYMFVLRNAYGKDEDGITEIDIHIKVKPSTFPGVGALC